MYPSSLDSTWILEIKSKDRKKKKETEPAIEIIEGRLSRLRFFLDFVEEIEINEVED